MYYDALAYERAVKSRIYANAKKGRRQRVYGSSPVRNELETSLRRMIETQRIPCDLNGPAFLTDEDRRRLQFPLDLLYQYLEYGKLSDKQIAWVEKLASPEAAAAHEAEVAAKNAARAAVAAASQHVGASKEKVEFTATVELAKPISTRFGLSTLLKMRDQNGNCLVWWCSSPEADYVAKGDVISGRGTVKAHDEYQGEKQTTLTRCSVAWPRTSAA